MCEAQGRESERQTELGIVSVSYQILQNTSEKQQRKNKKAMIMRLRIKAWRMPNAKCGRGEKDWEL